jgi:hypothetical protein
MTWPTSPLFYSVAILAIVMVGLAKGGFAGLGAAAMPMLALVMDPLQAAAMMLPILIAQDVISVWSFRRDYDAETLWLMIPGGLAGVGLGWFFSASVDADAVRGLVGGIAVVFGGYRLLQMRGLGLKSSRPLSRWWACFWGAMSGFTSHVAHAGGPPFQVWALTRNFPHLIFIGTSSIFFAALNLMKVPAYLALGQFHRETLMLTAAFMPLAILSTMAGVKLVRRIDPAKFQTIISVLMIVVGAELLRVAFT